jgi:hypothetical protein
MATKTANASKDARIALSGSLEMGAGASNYNPIGLYSGYLYRAVIGFSITSSWFSGMFQFVSAVFHYRTSTQYYVAFGSDPDMLLRRLTEDFSEGSAVSLSTSNSVTWANQPSATTSGEVTETPSESESTWGSKDISDLFEAILPSSVLKRDGNPGTGTGRFYGLKIYAVNEGSSTDTTEIYSDDTSSEPYVVVTYTTNAAPTAPVITAPLNGALLNTATPTVTATTTDSNDTEVDWDIQIDNNSDFSSPLVNLTGYESGTGLSLSYPTSGLTQGVLLYLRVRARDDGGAVGPWSATRTFTINRAPTATKTSPTASDFAEVWNLNEAAIWTLAGAHAKAWFRWTYSDPDNHGQSAYRVRVYSASSGGSTLMDTGKVMSANNSHQGSLALVLGTEYWWTIEVWDSNDYSSGESSRTGFKVKWGQVIYEHNPGAGSGSYQFTTGTLSGGTMAVLFRSATGSGGAGASAWQSSIGAVTPNAFLQIMVRLSTSVVGTNPTLADMTFTYLGSSSQPDRWVFSPSNEWALDPAQRRYGSQSLKCTINPATSGDRHAYPYRKTVGDEVPVIPGTTRTFSAYIKTNGILSGGSVYIEVMRQGGITQIGQTVAVTDTSAYPDGWQRLQMTYVVPEGVTFVRPQVTYVRTSGVAESFWIDGAMDEEGTVASQWQPGFVGDPVILDSNGVVVDAASGGIFRLRGSDGGSRDQIELGLRGLLFGGDMEVRSPAQGEVLLGDDTLRKTLLTLPGGPSGTLGGGVRLLGAAANTDVYLENDTGTLMIDDGGSTTGVMLRPTDGAAELIGSTPYIDFKNSIADDRDARIILTGDDLLEVRDAHLDVNNVLYFGALAARAGADKFAQTGTGTLVWSGSNNASAAVTFPVAFGTAPVVIAWRTQATSSAPKNQIWAGVATTTGFTVYGTVPDGGTSSASITYAWLAIDMSKIQ